MQAVYAHPRASQAAEGMFEGLHQFFASPEDLLISRHLNGHDVDGFRVVPHQVLKGKHGENTSGLVDFVTVDVTVDELNMGSNTSPAAFEATSNLKILGDTC